MSHYRTTEEALVEEARTLEGRADSTTLELERLSVAAFVHDGRRIIGANRLLESWFGYGPRELVGCEIGVLCEGEDHRALLATIGAGSDPPERPHIQRFRTKYGQLCIGQALARELGKDSRLVLIQPWAATLRSAGLLRLLEAAVDQLNDIVFITEVDSIDSAGRRVVFVNSAFSRVTGFDPHEVIGRTPNLTVGQATQRDALKRIEASLGSGKPVHEQLLKYGKDGSTYWVDLTIIPVFDDHGNHTHWLSVQRDITENKRLLEKLVETERLASAGMLAAGLTHEINNPLTSVTSSLEWLAEQLPLTLGQGKNGGDPSFEQDAEAIASALSDALAGAKRVETTLRYLGELAGTQDDVMQPVDVCDLMDAALDMLGAQLKLPGSLVREYRRVPLVLGSEARLTHVFFNLLLNAAQALSHEKSATNRIVVRVSEDPAGKVRIEVEDTGCGVPAQIARRLFSPFVSSRPRGWGKGLGLFMAREIVRSLSGEISYRTELGAGTTFSVLLPAGGPRARSTLPVQRLSAAIADARILLVDSDPLVARTLRRLLPACQLVAVQDCTRALEILEADKRFDIVVTELVNGALAGPELRERAGALDARLSRRFVFTIDEKASAHQRAGATRDGLAVLEKPFDRAAARTAFAVALGVPADG